MTEHDAIFSWLEQYEFQFIDDFDLVEKKKVQAKEIYQMCMTILFWEICLKRIQELADGYRYAVQNHQRVNMSLMARAALETFSVCSVQLISLESLFKSEFRNKTKLKEYEERMRKLFVGLREFNKEDAVKATNIIQHLEKTDIYLKSLGLDFLSAAYADLSNMCHPNLSGMAGNYGIGTAVKVSNNKTSRMHYFEALLYVIKHFDQTVQVYREMVVNDGEQFFE